MPPLYRIAHWLMTFIFHVLFPVRIHGSRALPEGPVIVVANHKSNWDAPLVSDLFDRHVAWLAKVELFKNPVLRWLMNQLGALPVDRGSSDIAAIRSCINLLGEGKVLGIFPQGTRVHDDSSFEMAGGASMIALRSKASVVPIRILGNYKLFRRSVNVYIGEAFVPFDPNARVNRDTISEISAEVKRRVLELGQDTQA